jgi:hypothetical protein
VHLASRHLARCKSGELPHHRRLQVEVLLGVRWWRQVVPEARAARTPYTAFRATAPHYSQTPGPVCLPLNMDSIVSLIIN